MPAESRSLSTGHAPAPSCFLLGASLHHASWMCRSSVCGEAGMPRWQQQFINRVRWPPQAINREQTAYWHIDAHSYTQSNVMWLAFELVWKLPLKTTSSSFWALRDPKHILKYTWYIHICYIHLRFRLIFNNGGGWSQFIYYIYTKFCWKLFMY